MSAVESLRQLECSMADLTQPYDDLAAHYDQIFEDWEASIARQSTVLAGILDRECGDRRPIRVLDCACGIGTQSLGLAMKGFDVTGCDISIGAVQRARSGASKRELSVTFLVANMVQLSAIPESGFDAVICIDNSLPHLQTDEDLLRAAQQTYGKLRPGGSFIGSIRDYDRLVVGRPTTQGPSFIRITVAGALFFKSGIGWMSDAIASICTSRETRNLRGRRSISPRPIVQCFGVSCSVFWKRQDSSIFNGCRHLTGVSINQSLWRTVTVDQAMSQACAVYSPVSWGFERGRFLAN